MKRYEIGHQSPVHTAANVDNQYVAQFTPDFSQCEVGCFVSIRDLVL